MSELKRLTIPHSERIDDTPLEACKHCVRGLGVDYPPCSECKHMNKALDKLTEVEDALEREGKEPCDKCCAEYGRYHKTNGYSLIKHNFCPECGRKLEG